MSSGRAEVRQHPGPGERGVVHPPDQACFRPIERGDGHVAPLFLLLRRMKQAVRNYLVFLWRCGRLAFVGDWRYYTWVGVLSVFCLLGLNAYARQFANGLIVTGMSDEVSWGVYIANFTFLEIGRARC